MDGRLLEDPGAPALSVLDHGFVVGDGVFETIQVRAGAPFALTRHLERLERSAGGLGLDRPDLGAVREGVAAVVAGVSAPFGRIRVTVTDGRGPLGSGRVPGRQTVAVVGEDADPPSPTGALITVPWTRNERGALAGLKTTSYGENARMLAAAHVAGASEAVMANTRGMLCEGTGSNVLWVVDGELFTPPLTSGCLAGVTRALVLEWVGAVEVDAPLAVLHEAEEVLLVSTGRDVQAVTRVDDRELDAPGPVTARAQKVFAERAALEVDP